MSAVKSPKQPLVLNFKDDTLTTVSRSVVQALAKKLGFNETQTVLYALARLRDEVLADTNPIALLPITQAQHRVIAQAAPKVRGKIVDSLLP